MTPSRLPKYELMHVQRPTHRPRRLGALALAAALAATLAGCGTPAVVKPVATPLPGLGRDVQAARNAVAQTDAQAQSDAATGATQRKAHEPPAFKTPNRAADLKAGDAVFA